MRKPIAGLTLIKTSKQLAPVSALLVASLLSGMAAAQQPVPQSPPEQQQQPAPPAYDSPPGLVPPPAEVPPPQYAPPPQYLPPPAMAGVPVRFAASDGGDYIVSAAGALAGQCRVPCTLQLAPGLNTIRVSGSMTLTANVSIPNAPSVVELKRGSPGIRATGLVLFILGSLGAVYLAATDGDELSTAESEVRLEIAIADVVLVIVGASMALGAARAGVDVRPDTNVRASARGGAIRFGGIAAAPIRGGALLGATLQF